MLDTLIIGAGVSGLVAAYRLAAAGKQVAIFEPGSAGGLIRTLRQDGFTCEQGPNVLIAKEALSRLLTEINLAGEMVYPTVERYAQCVWFRDKIVDVPKSLGAFLGSELFPTRIKALLPIRALTPGLMKPQSEDEPAADFIARLIGKEATAAMLQPVLQGIYGGDAARLSARSLFPDLWNHAAAGHALITYGKSKKGGKRGKIFVLRSGMHSLVNALVERLPEGVMRRSAVERLEYLSAESCFAASAGGAELRARSVLVTTAGAATAGFLAALDTQAAMELKALKFAPLVVAHIDVPPEERAKIRESAFGVLFPPRAAGRVLGIMYNSSLFPHVAPRDRHLLTVCLGGSSAPEATGLTDGEVTAEVNAVLRRTLGLERPRCLSIYRWERAIPQLEVGHFKLLARLREAERRYPGLRFLGADTGGVGIPDRVQSAEDAAAWILSGAYRNAGPA